MEVFENLIRSAIFKMIFWFNFIFCGIFLLSSPLSSLDSQWVGELKALLRTGVQVRERAREKLVRSERERA